jgi:DNA-directed RNA polymerase specialized sigma24 family protein
MQSLDGVFRREWGRTVAAIARWCGDLTVAEDAVQEAFFSAYRNLARFRGDSFRSWLTRIALNAAHDILRVRGTNAEELGLTDPNVSDEAIIAAMIIEPILVNRPIVVTPKGAALCRPAELVLGLIEA